MHWGWMLCIWWWVVLIFPPMKWTLYVLAHTYIYNRSTYDNYHKIKCTHRNTNYIYCTYIASSLYVCICYFFCTCCFNWPSSLFSSAFSPFSFMSSSNMAVICSDHASFRCPDMSFLFLLTGHPTSANLQSTSVSGHSFATCVSTVDRVRVR